MTTQINRRQINRRQINRRSFLRRGTSAGMAIGLGGEIYATSAKAAPRRGANDKIRLGFIGLGGMGRFDLDRFKEKPNTDIVALCDVHLGKLPPAEKALGTKADKYQDFRKVLDRKDIDAVVIATPDHWHCLIAIHACMAGKDVYVEKPLSLCVAEGRELVKHARKHKRVVQVGTQQRSGPMYREAVEVIGSGQLGKITMVKAWNLDNRWPGIGHPPDSDPPKELDWDMWLGPRPKRPYNAVRAAGSFRGFWDYSGGTTTDWGTHHMDTIREAMGVLAPKRVAAWGGKYVIDDIFETPDTLNIIYDFGDWTLHYELHEANSKGAWPGGDYGIVFYGTEYTMFLDRGGYHIYPEHKKDKDAKDIVVGTPGKDNFMPQRMSKLHVQNFLDCVVSRKRPNADVEIGHRSTTLPHLGNVALHAGRSIQWDPEKEICINDPEATKLLSRKYRAPWELPKA